MTNEEYQSELLELLEMALACGYSLNVQNKQFRVTNNTRDKHTFDSALFNINYTKDSAKMLDSAKWGVQVAYQELVEAQKKHQLKQTALSKLTPEERKALDL